MFNLSTRVILAVAVLGLSSLSAPAQTPSAQTSWAPPSADAALPPADSQPACVLADILTPASKRVKALVDNMQKFSATEQAEFQEFDEKGYSRGTRKAKFDYVAYISEVGPQQLNVEEYRNDSVAPENFPSRLATIGTAAFALLFHSNYIKDFTVTCEGHTEWQGRPAWRLHLRQSQPNNFRGYRISNRYFPVELVARAWIDADTFEVLHLETDLLHPIPQIPLLLEHVSVDYGTVNFPRRDLQLWLPQTADIYMDYRGRRYHHHHAFSNFQLFWVDTDQKVKGPKVEQQAGH